jgi:hypothetical protein
MIDGKGGGHLCPAILENLLKGSQIKRTFEAD